MPKCATCGATECGHLKNDPVARSAGELASIRNQLLLQPKPAAPPASLVPSNDPPAPTGGASTK